MKEMVQRQEDVIFSSGIEFSTNTMLLRHSKWMNHLVRNDFLGCNLDILEFAFGSVLVMTDDSHAENLHVGLLASEMGSPQATKYVSERANETSQVSTQKFTVITSQELELRVHERHVL